MTDIISFGVQLYPKTVKITKGTGIASFLPDNDPSKAFDVTDDVMATVVEALANAYPADQLVPTKIVAGQSIRGVDGT